MRAAGSLDQVLGFLLVHRGHRSRPPTRPTTPGTSSTTCPSSSRIDGITFGQRWVRSPRCRAAEAATSTLLEPFHYMTLYLLRDEQRDPAGVLRPGRAAARRGPLLRGPASAALGTLRRRRAAGPPPGWPSRPRRCPVPPGAGRLRRRGPAGRRRSTSSATTASPVRGSSPTRAHGRIVTVAFVDGDLVAGRGARALGPRRRRCARMGRSARARRCLSLGLVRYADAPMTSGKQSKAQRRAENQRRAAEKRAAEQRKKRMRIGLRVGGGRGRDRGRGGHHRQRGDGRRSAPARRRSSRTPTSRSQPIPASMSSTWVQPPAGHARAREHPGPERAQAGHADQRGDGPDRQRGPVPGR